MTSPPAGDPLGRFSASPDGLEDISLPGPFDDPSRRWRRLMVWSATSTPVALLLSAGVAFGPLGINLLPAPTMPLLDAAVPVALAGLGVLVGLSVGDGRADAGPTFKAASLAAAVTILVVAAGFGAVAFATLPVSSPFWILILAGGICAATSLTLPADDPLEPRSSVTRVIELGVLLPIVAGGLLLAWLATDTPAGVAILVVQACGVTLALAGAAWLLLTRTSSETEERVFAVAALLLVGGAAAALSSSALFGGLVAGGFWRYAGRHPRTTISRDVLFVQHPLLVLVLLMAGARAELYAGDARTRRGLRRVAGGRTAGRWPPGAPGHRRRCTA